MRRGGWRKGPEGRFFRWIAGSWEASLLLRFISVCICRASPCVFLHAAASSNLHFLSFCNLFVDLTCGLEVHWKRTLCKHKDFGALCNCYILGVVFILCLLNLQPLWVPGEGRLMHRNLSRSLALGHHVTFIMRIVCQTWTGRCHRGCTGAF